MLKSSDPRMTTEKYGGYNKLTGAYFTLVEHTSKKKRVHSLETVFLMHKALYEQEPERYCREILGLKEPLILIPKIRINSLISYDGFRMHLSGRTGSQIIYKNANPLVISSVWHVYIKAVSKYLERCRAAGGTLEITRFDGLDQEKNARLYQLLLEKLENPKYHVKFATPAATLRECQDKFSTLETAD